MDGRWVLMPLGVAVAAVVGSASARSASSHLVSAAPRVVGCQRQLIPTPRRPGAYLERIAFSPHGDAWAVGGTDSRPYVGVILHLTASRFMPVPIPKGTGDLRDVVAPAANDAWAVGINRVLHWDGRRWSRTKAPAGSLWAVSASGPDDVWAVGTSGLRGVLVIHWDGTAWKRVPFLPIPAETQESIPGGISISFSFLEGVLAISPDDVWVVGSGADETAIIVHWDGESWTAYPGPQITVGRDAGFGSLAAHSSGNVWAAGGIRGGSMVAEWDGTAWRDRGSSASGVPDIAVRRGEIWAIYGDALARWDGSSWRPLEKRHPNLALRGLAVARSGDVWAAGYWLGSPKQRSAIYRYRCTSL